MRSRLKYLPLVAVLACGGSDSTGINTGGGGTTSAPATASVEMKSNQFSPSTVRVAKGGTVNWTNSDGYPHNVTFTTGSGLGDVADFSTGVRSSTMPPSPATITFQCTRHAGMNGTLKVE